MSQTFVHRISTPLVELMLGLRKQRLGLLALLHNNKNDGIPKFTRGERRRLLLTTEASQVAYPSHVQRAGVGIIDEEIGGRIASSSSFIDAQLGLGVGQDRWADS